MQQLFDSVAFGERLRQARINNALTMMQVQDGLYVSQSVLSRYEHGLVFPTIERVFELANLYGCSIDWLCGMKEVDDDE